MINDNFEALRESFDLQYEIPKYRAKQNWKLIRCGFENSKFLYEVGRFINVCYRCWGGNLSFCLIHLSRTEISVIINMSFIRDHRDLVTLRLRGSELEPQLDSMSTCLDCRNQDLESKFNGLQWLKKLTATLLLQLKVYFGLELCFFKKQC